MKLSRAADTTDVTGYVYWFDCSDVEGNRPGSLDLVLKNDYANSSVTYTVNKESGLVTERAAGRTVGTVSENEWTGDSSVWTYTISGLRKNYINSAGESAAIYYYVNANATPIMAYYPEVRSGEAYGLDVALTHRHYSNYAAQASQDYTVNLMWLDSANAWGNRPNANGVKVDLLANGEVYDTVYLTRDHEAGGNKDAWTHTFKSIPTYRNGAAIVWSVGVPDVDHYIKDLSAFTATASTIKYTQAIGFGLTANWNDSDNDDARRPAGITVNVYGDGSLVGSVEMPETALMAAGIDGNTWTGSIAGLPVWREDDPSTAIRYTFQWDDATREYFENKGYAAAPTMNGEPVESDSFYWLSADRFGDSKTDGYDSLSNSYQWETTLNYNKEKAD